MANIKAVLFDFDGVIADTFEYCLRKNQAIDSTIDANTYRAHFYGNFYADFMRTKYKPEEIKEIYKNYWKDFEKDLDQIELFPEMKDILDKLAKKHKMVIVSSCKDELLERVMQKEEIRDLFEAIYGSSYHESKVEKFKHVLRDFKLKADECIFVTDTLGDLHEAEKAGIESIAVSWGFHNSETLGQGKSKVIIHEPKDILTHVK